MKKLLTNIIGSVAPTLGTALGGPLGGMAGDVISKVLGCDNDPVSLEKAISAATPEQLLVIKKAEKEIDVLKKNAPEKINKIAIETSSEILKKLIGADVNNSSISAIVDDLSKKGGNKYYGN